MDVETNEKTTNRTTSKEEMNHKSPSQLARTLKLVGVQLKIVGENLSILKDYKDNLELTCAAEGEACRVSFSRGEREKVRWSTEASLVSMAPILCRKINN